MHLHHDTLIKKKCSGPIFGKVIPHSTHFVGVSTSRPLQLQLNRVALLGFFIQGCITLLTGYPDRFVIKETLTNNGPLYDERWKHTHSLITENRSGAIGFIHTEVPLNLPRSLAHDLLLLFAIFPLSANVLVARELVIAAQLFLRAASSVPLADLIMVSLRCIYTYRTSLDFCNSSTKHGMSGVDKVLVGVTGVDDCRQHH
jgi:hypothetical protein